VGAFGIKGLPAAHARPGVQHGLGSHMPVVPLLGSPQGDAKSVSHLLEGFLPLLGFDHVGGAPFPFIFGDVHDGISYFSLCLLKGAEKLLQEEGEVQCPPFSS